MDHYLTRTMESNKEEKTKILFLNQCISLDTEICRYMDFDAFLNLVNGQFYVPRKQTFLDSRESGNIPTSFRFAICPLNIDGESITDNLAKDQAKINQYIGNLVESRFLLTSCWTIGHDENYLMWKSYTEKNGVCVRTTIRDFMNAIDLERDNHIAICSPMYYDKINTQESYLESVLKKNLFYQSENEIRFYFASKDNFINENYANMGNEDVEKILKETANKEEKLYRENPKRYKMFKIFDINPNFINSIVLSPFIIKNSVDNYRTILMGKYNHIFKNKGQIIESQITLNK